MTPGIHNDTPQEYEDKEKWLTRGSASDRSVSGSGGWAPRVTETLPPRPYFLASQSPSVSVSGDTSYYNQQAADALLERLGVSSHSLDIWTENVRKWISQTIFQVGKLFDLCSFVVNLVRNITVS